MREVEANIVYWLDENDVIVDVSDRWDDLAEANGGERCLRDSVIGRKLRDFITGEATKMLLDTLITSARLRDRAIERPYRCDSPDTKRFMTMRLRREGGLLRLEHLQERVEPTVTSMRFESVATSDVLRCSMCGRVRRSKSQEDWHEPDSEFLDDADECRLRVIYSVCGTCKGSVRRDPG